MCAASLEYICQIDEVTVNIFIANSADTVVALLLVSELSKGPMEEKSVEDAGNSLLHLPPFQSLQTEKAS